MFEHVTRPHHFILPILMILLGGYVMTWTDPIWLWAGVVIWFVAVCLSIWLSLSGIVQATLDLLRERSISKEEPVPAKDKLHLVIDHYTDTNNHNTSYRYLSISPEKMKHIAQACLNGTPFSLRVWSGQNKLLSDPEFRLLKDELLELGFLTPRSEKDERQGYEWTETGRVMLQECLEDEVPK